MLAPAVAATDLVAIRPLLDPDVLAITGQASGDALSDLELLPDLVAKGDRQGSVVQQANA